MPVDVSTAMLPSGLPKIEPYLRIEDQPEYAELFQHSREFNASFGAADKASRQYITKWVSDPFLQWSRRWEYVYALQRLRAWFAGRSTPCDIVDAGSGFTFFPFYLQSQNAQMRILCFDNDVTAGNALQTASLATDKAPLFRLENLEQLTQADQSVDAIYSLSVIEHTANPARVVDEMHRVLKPGGLFVCTFDISFELASPMHVRHVKRLLAQLCARFDLEPGWENTSIDGVENANDVVTTEWISRIAPERLPWRHPRTTWLYDALRGRVRRSLYRPMTFYCGTFIKPQG